MIYRETDRNIWLEVRQIVHMAAFSSIARAWDAAPSGECTKLNKLIFTRHLKHLCCFSYHQIKRQPRWEALQKIDFPDK